MSSTKEPSAANYLSITQKDLELRNVKLILVVSDFHMSEGYSPKTFRWHRIENFTSDNSFAEFLRNKSELAAKQNSSAWLIINGDFIDFLRIISIPQNETDLKEWENILKRITTDKLPEEKTRVLNGFNEFAELWRAHVLPGKKARWKMPSQIRDELKYGFKTHDFKSVYRLMLARDGHLPLFKAMMNWLVAGNAITIISGNHDKEFTQKLVQVGLLWMLEDLHRAEYNTKADFSNLLNYEKIGIEIEGNICIEHGHRFEALTRANQKELDSEHHELFLAPGSLFNRYLINRLELEVPYFDNIRPTTRVIGYLARNHPFRFLQSLIKMLETSWRLARRSGCRRLLMAGLLKLVQIFIPAIYLFWLFLIILSFNGTSLRHIWNGPDLLFGFSFKLYAAIPILVIYFWLLGKIQQKLNLHFSEEEAAEQMTQAFTSQKNNTTYYAVCGHTHETDIKHWAENIIYINSGTWTPVFDYQGGHIRDDMTMTFAEFSRSEAGWRGKLFRWLPLHNKETDVDLIQPRMWKGKFPKKKS